MRRPFAHSIMMLQFIINVTHINLMKRWIEGCYCFKVFCHLVGFTIPPDLFQPFSLVSREKV